MKKQGDLQQLLNGMGNRMSDAGQAIQGWYGGLNPDLKSALLRGLVGAGVGAGVTGGIAALTPRDREDRRSVVGPALLGALLGGGGAAALPYGMRMLSGGIKFAPEPGRSAGAKVVESLLHPVVENPLATAGLGYGAWTSRTSWSELAKRLRTASMIHPNASAAARLSHVWKRWPEEVMRSGQRVKVPPKLKLLLAPILMGLGATGDKYLRGEY